MEEHAFGIVARVVGGGDDVCPAPDEDAREGGVTDAAGLLLDARAARRGAGGHVCRKGVQRHAGARADVAHEGGVCKRIFSADAVLDVDGGEGNALRRRAGAQIVKERGGVFAAREGDAHATAAQEGEIGLHTRIILQICGVGKRRAQTVRFARGAKGGDGKRRGAKGGRGARPRAAPEQDGNERRQKYKKRRGAPPRGGGAPNKRAMRRFAARSAPTAQRAGLRRDPSSPTPK